MASKIFCQSVESLAEFTTIAGGREILEFEVLYTDGTPVDLQAVQQIYWLLCRYGNPDYAVLKRSQDNIYDVNKFQIDLTPQDTQNLSGKYIQQPVIVDFYGYEHRFSQGIINFIPGINQKNVRSVG